jgi:hypothetical protein
MRDTENSTLRRAGVIGVAGGALTAVSGLVVEAIVKPASDVSDDMWSYPWSGGAFVAACVLYAVFHALVFVGVLGYARSGAAGPGRGARIGTGTALIGTAVLFAAELLSIPIADQRVDDTGAGLVGACFGLGSFLSAIGFIAAGVATMRAAHWDGWRRYVPLATGAWLMALVFLAMTPLLPIGVALYGVLIAALGVALVTQPTPTPSAVRPRTTTIQV